MVEYVVYFVYFVYFVYSVYFVYFGMVEYSTFCVVRRSFQTLFHITPSSFITKCQKKRKSLVGHNTSSEQTTWLRSKWNSINCKNIVKQCEKLSYSYWFIDRDFDDLSNGDYSQQSIALIAIIFVSAIIALLIPFAECVPRPSFFQIFDYF